MCRNIKRLDNFEPPATREEIHAAALQYVRKISGTRTPSKANVKAFERAITQIQKASEKLLDGWVSTTPSRNREEEIEKAREKWQKREERIRNRG